MIKIGRAFNKFNSASIWKRLIAYIVDFIIVNLIVTLPLRGYLNNFNSFNLLLSNTDKNLMAFSFFIIIVLIFYFAILEYKLGQTLGKMIVGIYVTSTHGKLRFTQCILRNITKPFPIVLLVDVAYMFFKQSNQRLFEVFSSTTVIEKEMNFK